ncbi:MAG: hybrid sensor histidine kinase/response regulator [Methanosarcinales archaeon]|nr:MAG: hybrid sensor histidine kinase/response regulator [Methanosarcinales archaeon]
MSNEQKVGDRETGGKTLIHIVDDVPKNIQVVGNILRGEDCEIAFSQNGGDALNRIKSNPADLILLDIMMPGMDGYEVCEKLRNDPKTKDIPVIFLTAKTDPDSAVRGFEVGGQDYLTKPFNSAELLARVHTQLKLKKNRDLILRINERLKQEIAERALVEEELRAHREHIKLINQIMRHDIINDLVVIDSELQLYDELCDDELLRKAAVRVGKSVDLINRIRKLEVFINTHRGLKPYSVTQVLRDIVKSYPYTTFNIEGNVQALADESLSSVLDNLINNAVSHGKTDRIDITMKTAGDFCEIRIADYGSGIPDAIKENIFEESFMYGETGNTGLGLYIVRKIMGNYGGCVHVEDNTPQGAVFVLALKNLG